MVNSVLLVVFLAFVLFSITYFVFVSETTDPESNT